MAKWHKTDYEAMVELYQQLENNNQIMVFVPHDIDTDEEANHQRKVYLARLLAEFCYENSALTEMGNRNFDRNRFIKACLHENT